MTRILTKSDIAKVLSMADCVDAVEAAFLAHAKGETIAPGVLGTHVTGGGFHVKTAGMTTTSGSYYVAKVNANFPDNPRLRHLPTVQGALLLYDAADGRLLAVMDSAEITRQRTAAAAAVAAKYLARRDSRVITISGCGTQGHAQLAGFKRVFPLERAFAFDVDRGQRERFAQEMSAQLKIAVEPVDDIALALRQSDIAITCTPSHHYYVRAGDLPAGIFIAAMGADSPEKQEIDPALLAKHKLVVDILEQCENVGELHHAIEEGLMTRDDIHAQLGQVIAGKRPGRSSLDEIIIFDSTGTALQDVAAAALVYEKARAAQAGTAFKFLG